MLNQMLKKKVEEKIFYEHQKDVDSEDFVFKSHEWTEFFDEHHAVQLDGVSFGVYVGGKLSPDRLTFVLLHGCGFSSLSWGLVTSKLKNLAPVVCLDFRGHGSSFVSSSLSSALDLSLPRLCEDVERVLSTFFTQLCSFSAVPPLFMVGHSMGGAVAAHVVSRGSVA